MGKKILAREFLFLLITLLLNGIIFMALFYVDNENKSRSKLLEEELFIMKNFEPYVSLQTYTKIAKEWNYDYSKVNSRFPELAEYDTQALKDYCATVEEKDYNFIELNSKFPEFGFNKDGSHKNFDLKAYEQVKKELSELTKKPAYLTRKTMEKIIAIVFSVVFILRYLVYATIWSLRQLN